MRNKSKNILRNNLILYLFYIITLSCVNYEIDKGVDEKFELISTSKNKYNSDLLLNISPDGRNFSVGYESFFNRVFVVNDTWVKNGNKDSFLPIALFDKTGENFGLRIDQGDFRYVYINEKKLGPYDNEFIVEYSPRFSDDGKNWWFGYRKDRKWYLNFTGTIWGPYDGDIADNPQIKFEQSTKHYGIKYKKENQFYFDYDSQIWGPYDYIDKFYLLEEQNFVMLVEHEGQKKVITNDKEIELDKSARFHFNVVEDTWFISQNGNDGNYINGERVEYKKIIDVINRDGRDYIFSHGDGGYLYLNNNKIVEDFDKIVDIHIEQQVTYVLFMYNQSYYYFNGENIQGPFEYVSSLYNKLGSGITAWVGRKEKEVFLNHLNNKTFSVEHKGEFNYSPFFLNYDEPAILYLDGDMGKTNFKIIKSTGEELAFGPFHSYSISYQGISYLTGENDSGHYIIYKGKQYGPFKALEDHKDENGNIIIGIHDDDGYIKTYKLK